MRLGVLGGSFNPIHLGHLVLAEAAREQCRLDQVWLIPTATPPHKPGKDLAGGAHRLAMVRLAVRGHPAFRASDLELRLGGVSYSLRTVRRIRQQHPRASLSFIVGADMLQVAWYGLEELVRLCRFVVAGRPELVKTVKLPRGFKRLAMPEIGISSSLIRSRIRRGHSIRYLVPDGVARYLTRHRLYEGGSR